MFLIILLNFEAASAQTEYYKELLVLSSALLGYLFKSIVSVSAYTSI